MFGRSHASRTAHASTQPLAHQSTRLASSPSLQQRAEHLASTLPWEACRTLVEAAAPILFEHPTPFAPTDPQVQLIAEWLWHEVGALAPLSAGYAPAYRPTLLGLYVVWHLLLDGARQRGETIQQRRPSGRL
jgi:hypothetical protein